MIIPAHSVKLLPSGFSWMQERLLHSDKFVRLVAAPTGSGKSYAFMRAVFDKGAHVLFIVPTKRLLQNLIDDIRDQARKILRDDGWSEPNFEAWIGERILEWSGNQVPEDDETLRHTRARQALNAGAGGRILFAIPEVVVNMISGIRAPGANALHPFFFVRRFDHIVFDEFHTIDDRAFGLAYLLARCAVEERQGRVSLLSATPINVSPMFERLGIASGDIDVIHEQATAGHPAGCRPIHGNVELLLRDCTVCESFCQSIDDVRDAMAGDWTVIVIYDSLQRLKKEEPIIRSALRNAGLEDTRIHLINSIDDSARKPGEESRGRRWADPREYDLLLCTSSVEVGVTFRSSLMFMEPGHDLASFMQRVGRVARGVDAGKVVISAPESHRKRKPWMRKVVRTIKKNSELHVESFTSTLLQDAKRRLEPSSSEIEAASEAADARFYRRPSWRGVYWAALFIVAVLRKMKIQRSAAMRLSDISPKTVMFVESKIRQILSVNVVDDCQREANQPHKLWVEALLASALEYRDIGATVTVIDPDGTDFPVREAFLRSATDILRTHIIHDRDGLRIVELTERTLDDEIVTFDGNSTVNKLNLHVRSPLGRGGFDLSIREYEKGSEHFHTRLVEEWRERFDCAVSARERADGSPRAIVMDAATDLVCVLGKPPLEEDYEASWESTMFA